ncbi:MAG: rRNA adenine N-6-methyltransferase family protein [Candidatus Uhrbacteria bacterium]
MEFFTRPVAAGAIMASGNELSELITDLAELPKAQTIVEFGPGTGVFTKEIIRKMSADALLISIEKDGQFIERLKTEFPNVRFYHDAASSITKHLQDNELATCDRIVSGLPWSIFSEQIQTETLKAAYDSLVPGGMFLTFAYIHSQFLPDGIRFKRLLKRTFKEVHRSRIAWKNVPPAFVYVCKK